MNDALQRRIQASFDSQGLMANFGARLALVREGEVHIALAFSPALAQQHGYVHGGVLASILDVACGYAAQTRAPAPGCEVVTAEFKINFMRPAIGTRFVAQGRVVQAGRTLAVTSGELRAFTDEGEDYKVAALMQATIAYLHRR